MNSRSLVVLIAIAVVLLIVVAEKPLLAQEEHGEARDTDARGLRLNRYAN